MIKSDSLAPFMIPGTAEIPFDPAVTTYTRFGAMRFEPFEYTGWVDECMSWKNTCYIGDWSPLSNKLLVRGPDALRFYSDISVNGLAKFDIGQAKHSIQCNDSGKVVCEGVLMRLAEDELLFTSGPTYWTEYQFERGGYNATAIQLGFGQFIKQVQGPLSLYVLEKVTGESLRDIGFMRFRKTRVGHREFHILRQGMSGEIGFELHGNSQDGPAIHQAILEAGKEFGIRRLGGRTKMINHVEACFPTPTVDYIPAMAGQEDYIRWLEARVPEFARARHLPHTGSVDAKDVMAFHRSPVELGWAKNIKFDHEFIGRAALEKEVADPKRNIVTLVWNKEDVKAVYASLFEEDEPHDVMELPRNYLGSVWADRVLKSGKLVGVSTSRCYSYHFRKMISLCTMDIAYCDAGTEVSIIWGRPGTKQKEIRATVAPAPYKQDNRRIDLTTLPKAPPSIV